MSTQLRRIEGVEVYLHSFLMLVLYYMKVSDQIHAPAALPFRKESRYRGIVGCVGHRACLDVSEKSKILQEEKEILNR